MKNNQQVTEKPYHIMVYGVHFIPEQPAHTMQLWQPRALISINDMLAIMIWVIHIYFPCLNWLQAFFI